MAMVAPEDRPTPRIAALLCDSLYPRPFTMSVADAQDFFTAMGLRHIQLAQMNMPQRRREEIAAGRSAYMVSR